MDVLGGPQSVESIPLAAVPHPDPAITMAQRCALATNSTAASASAADNRTDSMMTQPSATLFRAAPLTSKGALPGAGAENAGGSLRQDRGAAVHAAGQQQPGRAHAETDVSQAAAHSSAGKEAVESACVSDGAHNAVVQHGDSVMCFDEVSAARGALGRLPGREVMGLIKDFISARHRIAI